ncbi:MAG: CrcB family protein [Myxococcales bacterium]|nr:CrcB family protein [Myxococcales bacterium]MCB9755520.1 CrcB family protein [Myxococcales bacterium]
MPTWLWVFLAGGTGAVARYLLSSFIDGVVASRFPHAGVLLVNLLGCLLIGVFSAWLTDTTTRAAVLTGLLGGFTTYSAFALVTHDLVTSGRWSLFVAQVTIHLLGGLACAALGLWIGRLLRG